MALISLSRLSFCGEPPGARAHATDWPSWRGPRADGSADPDQDPPTEWSQTQSVAWKSPVPGRGYGSPAVVGPHVYLATADERAETQAVLCYDRESGEQKWSTVVHRGGLMRKHPKSTAASSTPACDGERVYITFANRGAVHVTALDTFGKQLWQTKIANYLIHQGYGASPMIHGGLVLACADSYAGGVIAGLDRVTGQVVWKHERPKQPNYTSPIVLAAAGKEQLVLTGCDRIASFDPATGEALWETPGATTECVTSAVTDGQRVFSSGGYPKNHLAAVLADGSGKVVWEKRDRVYVPSLLVLDGHLYGVLDAGVAACWKCDTGEQLWKERLSGTFSASPVRVGDRIYATNEEGQTFVYRADPRQFEQIATSKLGDLVMATPAICGGRIYMRVVEQSDDAAQEMLYCLAKDQ